MLKNNLTVALRNLWKNKSHTLINVLGLALGIASSIIIYFIVSFELSYDNFHEKADRIYRVTSSWEREGKVYYNSGVPTPLPEALRQDFAEDVEEVVVMEQTGGRVILEGETIFISEGKVYTENGYFSLFDFSLVAGNPELVLKQPNEVVLSEYLYTKVFGSNNYKLGKDFFFVDNDTTYLLEVVGIMKDLPTNTDFRSEMLISYSTQPKDPNANWGTTNGAFNVFVLLPETVIPNIISSRLIPFLKKYYNGEHKELIDKFKFRFHLQPLSKLHYETKYPAFPYRKMSKKNLSGLVILAVLLTVLACVNFVNLATAVSIRRSREIGVRKTLGSSRKQIILSFLGEAFLVTVLATILAFGLAELGLIQLRKLYTHLQPVDIQFGFSSLIFLLLLIVLVANLAGFYPAWLLSRFKPIHALNSKTTTVRGRKFPLRHGLVIFQFFISQIFIVCVIVIAQQLDYLKNAPLGFNEKEVLTVDLQDQEAKNRERFKAAMSKESAVSYLSFSAASAISQSMSRGQYEVDGEETNRQADIFFADHNFFDTHNMELLAGAIFTPSDSGSGFVVNESFVKDVGLEQPEQALGKYISMWGLELPIVGVIADYHTRDFSAKIPPLLITNRSSNYNNLSLRIDMEQAQAVIDKLKKIWQVTYPEYDFRYEFLDDRVARFYQDYDRTFSLAQLFAGIAILISCLGLYGLVMFMAERRTKEVGIRKVLGASVQQIVGLFSKEFVKLIFVAFVLAVPLAYYLMQQWLRSFAYTIEIDVLTFVTSLVSILLIVLLTVSYQSIKAAMANPVDSLRNE
ncbi:MAG: FtsX-like permease family protein [Bacteroidota bacterium]